MSSKYDKTIQMSREEEGSYHRREVEHLPPAPGSTKNYSTQSYKVVPVKSGAHKSKELVHPSYASSDDDNFEEWTTSKSKVNHKTRQVETRVSRQLLVEDGKVIADSGPQVTTRIKEDNRVEEVEKEKAPKNKGKFDAIENAPEGESSGRVLGEKKAIQRTSREVREENMQYHDERYKELTGKDVHRRAIQAPHELITINDNKSSSNSKPRGKMVHYSNKGKKYQDTDEVLEVAKLACDGSITKEVKRTKHHEEFSEDELPDEKGEAEALRRKPIVQKSSRRGADTVHDFNDTDVSDDDHKSPRESRHKQKHHHETHSEAFPPYEIDPLLNSLNDEDFRPISTSGASQPHYSSRPAASDRYRERHSSSSASSSDEDERHNRRHQQHPRQQVHQTKHASYRQRSPSPSSIRGGDAVEIPEEYRLNKQRLLTSKGRSSARPKSPPAFEHERGLSPTSKSHLSHRSGKSQKSHRSHKEDASVQAHLTDEEEERKSLRSSSSAGANAHEKTTKGLQRQSTVNSQRNYYYGNSRPRSPSERSYSSSSLSDPKERMRKSGARSKDSGFKSPHSMRTDTPVSTGNNRDKQQQIYSVSSKKNRHHHADERSRGAASPTPTTNSLGQRSVKTTTTTMSAGLSDRPLSRNERGTTTSSKRHQQSAATATKDRQVVAGEKGKGAKIVSDLTNFDTRNESPDQYDYEQQASSRRDRRSEGSSSRRRKESERPLDTESVSSLGPMATTIKVPYKQPQTMAVERQTEVDSEGSGQRFVEDLENLRKRLEHMNSRTITRSRGDGKGNEDKMRDQGPIEHFDYEPLVANVELVPQASRQRVVDTYNVRVIQHNSPFYPNNSNNTMAQRKEEELSSSIARLELLSSDLGSSSRSALEDEQPVSTIEITNQTNVRDRNTERISDNNNLADFNLNDYVKYTTAPVLLGAKESDSFCLDDNDDDDRVSLVSFCSLRSSRTYDVRSAAQDQAQRELIDDDDDDDLNDEKHFPVESLNIDQLADEKKPAAWVFDLRDGSSTAIKAPPKPKEPEPPKVDSKDLAQSRGGRSYYLELKETENPVETKRQADPVRSRLSKRVASSHQLNSKRDPSPQKPSVIAPLVMAETRKSRQIKPAAILFPKGNRSASLSNNKTLINQEPRRQLPFSGPPLGNRSKSSSCLIGSTRPSKYSIYGGLRQVNGDNKPVPRLSYSRAIGPKSQRQLDAQSKTPSRYLKMK